MATPIPSSTTPPLRSPLSTSTNSPPPRTPSPSIYATAKTTQPRPIRHQLSFRTFHPHLDSSESDPSAHSSLFEAVYLSPSLITTTTTADANANTLKRVSTRRSSGSSEGGDGTASTGMVVGAARDSFLGTPLETIAEQKSVATLRTVTSLPQMRSSRTRSLRPTTTKPSLALLPQHKHSFSANDLPLRLRHQPRNAALRSSDSTTATSPPGTASPTPTTHAHSHAHETYAHPNEPTASPPHRMPTPPGLPSFNTPAAHNYRIEPPTFRLRDFFSRNAHADANAFAGPNTIQTVGLPRGVVARGPDAVVRARWRPTQSGHTGQFGGPGIASHPFHAAGFAKTVTLTETPTPTTTMVGEPSVEGRAPEERPLRPQQPRSARTRRHVRFEPSSAGPAAEQTATATELYHRALSAEPAFRRAAGGAASPHFASLPGMPRGVSAAGAGNGRQQQQPQHGNWQEVADRSRWEGVCEFVCVACCGVERPGAGEEMASPVLWSGNGAGGVRGRRARGYVAGSGVGGYVP